MVSIKKYSRSRTRHNIDSSTEERSIKRIKLDEETNKEMEETKENSRALEESINNNIINKIIEEESIDKDNIIEEESIDNIDNTPPINNNVPLSLQISRSFIKSFSVDYSKLNFIFIKKYYYPYWLSKLCRIYSALKSIDNYNRNIKLTTIYSAIKPSLERMVAHRVEVEDMEKINRIKSYIDSYNTTKTSTTDSSTSKDCIVDKISESNNIIKIIKNREEYILYPMVEENEFYAICYEFIKIKYKIHLKKREYGGTKEFNPREIEGIEESKEEIEKEESNENINYSRKDYIDKSLLNGEDGVYKSNRKESYTECNGNTTAKQKCNGVLERIRMRELERRKRFILREESDDTKKRVLQLFMVESKRCIKLKEIVERLKLYNGRECIKKIKEFKIEIIDGEEYVIII